MSKVDPDVDELHAAPGYSHAPPLATIRSVRTDHLSLRTPRAAARLLLLALVACQPTPTERCPPEVCPVVDDPRFDVVVLGAQGGVVNDDLSAYLVAPHGADTFVCVDAGSVFTGLERAAALGSLGPDARADEALRGRIGGYLLSHAHLDHIAGLVMASPDDVPGKFIAASDSTLAALRTHIFNNVIWANFFTDGPDPVGLYTPIRLTEAMSRLPKLDLSVETYPLNHPGGASAFLLTTAAGDALLYLGDTTPDAVAGTDHLARLWKRTAPLIRDRHLRAIFIETSYPDPRPDERLYGHLTPQRLHAELTRLRAEAGDLDGLIVAITHIKPGPDVSKKIREQLAALPDLGVRFVFPAQGRRLSL